jgi:asparagine synthase (glutamine-hydrolysing)
MADVMRHRGPDQEAVLLLPELAGGLAVRRLALVDVLGGDQPIANEAGTVLALLNGEIYNHAVLRRELEAQGHHFRTRCDTEVLVHLYEELGDRFLARLEGMFGLAIFDRARRRLLIARDGPGMKPLYFARTAQGFVFASEVKALFASGLVEARPDLQALDVYLAIGFTPSPLSAFAGVERLPGGDYAVVDGAGVALDAFWRFAYRAEDPGLSDDAYVDELERRLTAAVESHVSADVPIGALLSGGWDSSLITTVAARTLGSRLKTFSIVFPDDPDADESRHSRRMAAWLGTDHLEIEYRPDQYLDLLPRVVRHLEEPLATIPTLLGFVLSSLAGAHVKGVIGGEGADELFGGYKTFRRPYPYWLRGLVPSPLAESVARRAPDHRVRRWMRIAAAPTPSAADAEWRRVLLPDEKSPILKPELRCAGPDTAPSLLDGELLATCRDSIQRRLAHEIRGRLADAILISHDKLAMAHSLEVRVPFLDRGVIELAELLPSRLKTRGGREKIVVGRLARRLLPPEIAARRKHGLAFPRSNWARSPAADRLRQFLLDGADRGPFLRLPLERLLRRRESMRGPNQVLATLVMAQAWWNEYF